MNSVSRSSIGLALVLAAAAVVPGGPVQAQGMVQPLPGTTDADRLAEQIRAIAARPNDLGALTSAGEYSLKLDDLSGAASLFARAERVDPRNGRVKAGMGSILVRSERPGEALRYFAMAESYGVDPRRFAADRGLAYDLIGQQERAQRDYRLALKDGADGETMRRYALSLGISGKREAALAELDPLLRQTDRGAWRARAFVLAMTGDQAGAERIATTMMPPGLAEGLQPFFQRLPALSPTDRAFAVHFGEIVASPERLADARLVPALPMLAEPAPVVLAAVTPTAAVRSESRQDRRARDRDRKAREQQVKLAAAVAPVAVPVRVATPSSAYRPPVTVLAANTVKDRPLTAAEAATLTAARRGGAPATPLRAPEPARITTNASAPAVVPHVVSPPVVSASSAPAVVASAPAVAPTPAPVRPAPVVASVVQPAPAVVQPVPAPLTPLPATIPPVIPSTEGPIESSPTPVAVAVTAPAAAPAPTPVETVTAAADPASPPVPLPATADKASEDTILARIIAGLSIPASELGVEEPVRVAAAKPVPAPDTAARVIAEAKAKEARDAAAEKLLVARTASDRRADAREDAAFKRTLAAAKLAATKRSAEAEAAAEEKKVARGNPARIWVQVAGGANEDDLPKAWAKVKAKASAVFGSRQGWSTPLRATNRVLAGPFKTDAEARTFVNQLGKAGMSAFTFASEAGQIVKKLPPR